MKMPFRMACPSLKASPLQQRLRLTGISGRVGELFGKELFYFVAFCSAGLYIAYAQSGGYTFVGVADWDRDGHQDIVARDASGVLWLYPGMSTRGYSTASVWRLVTDGTATALLA
ncbi:hypothetical protein PO002_27595 [Cupriavidus necator]|uniref:hypothetical protein n=1 Tax=Cupriavidus necator TaxID=106590 RepID=UPI0039C034BD